MFWDNVYNFERCLVRRVSENRQSLTYRRLESTTSESNRRRFPPWGSVGSLQDDQLSDDGCTRRLERSLRVVRALLWQQQSDPVQTTTARSALLTPPGQNPNEIVLRRHRELLSLARRHMRDVWLDSVVRLSVLPEPRKDSRRVSVH